MHELGLCEAIVEAVARRADGRHVNWARIRVGGHAVDPSVIVQGVELAAAGTPVEGARFDIVADPQRVKCRSCGVESDATDPAALVACPACGGVDVELVGSEQTVLEALGYRTQRPR